MDSGKSRALGLVGLPRGVLRFGMQIKWFGGRDDGRHVQLRPVRNKPPPPFGRHKRGGVCTWWMESLYLVAVALKFAVVKHAPLLVSDVNEAVNLVPWDAAISSNHSIN